MKHKARNKLKEKMLVTIDNAEWWIIECCRLLNLSEKYTKLSYLPVYEKKAEKLLIQVAEVIARLKSIGVEMDGMMPEFRSLNKT